ncbi:hypothetical protein diail_4419 [Diaporthe ilicicola]|nr:hypothetical protein diail_4419 [Diaporthe ilicicola]
MDYTVLDTVASADMHVKVLITGVLLLVSLLANAWVNKLWLSWRLRKFPIANSGKPQEEFMKNAPSVMRKGLETFEGQPFRVDDFSQSGPKLLLSPKYIDEIKNNPACDFGSFVHKDFYATYPGFEPFGTATSNSIFQDAVRKELSQVLALTIPPMVAEVQNTVNKVIGRPNEWSEVELQAMLLQCVSRLTSKIFLGPKFMDNPEWQYLCTEYTKDVNIAARRLNRLPPFVRPFVHWFLPECRKIRAEINQARALIQPEVDRRMEELRKHGGPRRRILDSVDWFIASMKGKEDRKFDMAVAEISLATAAIHTTTRTTIGLMRDLMAHPEYIQDLRDECVAVLKETGKMDKSALFKMRKMDSVLRESMRCNPASLANMPRLTTQEVKFNDGTVVPKGTYLMIHPLPVDNPELYPEPEKFDGYRFLRAREEPGAENKYQSVTTGTDFTFFGHGQHACPGRFLATNEIKLLVIYLLLQYDWQLPETQGLLPSLSIGNFKLPDGRQKALYKVRKPEVDISKFSDMDALGLEPVTEKI